MNNRMKHGVRRMLLYYLPLACNLALAAYLVWQLWSVPMLDRHSKFLMFSILYAVGGVVVAVSGITVFFHATAQEARGPRWLYPLAVSNTIIPTLLLLAMLRLA
jgi:heme/copper-type cytochrome/quinol oxidase subunit 2